MTAVITMQTLTLLLVVTLERPEAPAWPVRKVKFMTEISIFYFTIHIFFF